METITPAMLREIKGMGWRSAHPKGYEILGAGCFGRVFALPCGTKVLKIASADGTLDFIEWCYMLRMSGKNIDGLPIVYDVVRFEAECGYSRWAAIMDRCDYTLRQGMERGDVEWNDSYDIASEYVDRAKHRAMLAGLGTDDIHRSNVMWSEAREQWILVDPSSNSYSGDFSDTVERLRSKRIARDYRLTMRPQPYEEPRPRVAQWKLRPLQNVRFR